MTDAVTRLAKLCRDPLSQARQCSEPSTHPVEECVTIEDGPSRWVYHYRTHDDLLFEFVVSKRGRAHSHTLIDRVPEPGSLPN